MKLNKLFNLTKKGETLNEKQIEDLATHLGLRYSTTFLIFKSIISVVILLITIFCMVKIENTALNLILLLVCVLAILVIFLLKFNTKKIVKYLDVLKDFYINKFSDFEGTESIFIQHQFQKNGYLQNNLAILITDGYDFYIFDDIFKETQYLLPLRFKSNINKRPTLKVINKEFVNKRPVHFKLNEIAYYTLVKPFVSNGVIKVNLGSDYYRYTFTSSKFELDNYCMLVLEDGSTFKLGEDVVTLLRKKAIKKERS